MGSTEPKFNLKQAMQATVLLKSYFDQGICIHEHDTRRNLPRQAMSS